MTVEVIKPEVATVSHQQDKMKDGEESKPDSVEKSSSFKEESNSVSDLKDHEKKALSDFKAKLEQAILGNNLFNKVAVDKEQVDGDVEVEKVEAEESSKKKGFIATIQESFKGHSLFNKDDQVVVENKEKKDEECVEVKQGETVEDDKEKLVEGVEESSKKKGLNKLKSKIGEAFKGLKKDEPKVETVQQEDKKEEECAQEDVKEKEGETVKENVQQSSSKSLLGLNKFKSTIQEAFKGHSLFSNKSKKEVQQENKEESKPEGDDDKVDAAESKPECEDKEKEDVIETQECEPEAVVEEVAEEIKHDEQTKVEEEVIEVCEPEAVVAEEIKHDEQTKVEEEVIQVCDEENKVEEEVVVVDKDISLWGVPLLPSKLHEGTDVVLLKFLRARDFKVNEAFEMLKKTLEWRKEWKIDSILDEDLGNDLSLAGYMSGVDREGHPICYNIFGVLDDHELYQKTFASEEKRDFFLRWRFQLMERGIQKLQFKPTGVTSLLQITDLNNSPAPAKKEVRVAIKQALGLLQDNYPEFVARNIFINVSFWYYAYNAVFSTSLTQRTKSKLVFARPAKVTETLLKYIPVEEIPIQYGGLKRDSDFEFSSEDCIASELIIKASSTATIEIPAPQAGTTFIWDITVLGWDVNYKEEFIPTDECSYTIIVQKEKKLGSVEGPVRNTFRTNEAGKIVLTIDNCSNKKKKVFYRHKVKKSAF